MCCEQGLTNADNSHYNTKFCNHCRRYDHEADDVCFELHYVPISLGLFMDHTFGISAMNRPRPYLVSLSGVTLLAFSLKSLASEN